MTIIFPEATPVLGNLKVSVLDAVANLTAADLSTEIGDADTLDMSCFVRAWNPQITTNTGTAPSRLCTLLDLPREGKTQMPGISVAYPYDPQDEANATPENEAKALLVRGIEKFVLVRKGPLYTVPWAVGDDYELWKVRTGRQNRVQSGDDEFAEFEIQQMLFPVLEPVYGTVVA